MNVTEPASWIAVTKPDWSSEYYQAADVTYGSICLLCFLIGTLGNIVCFLYFKSKKRDISSVTYMMITGNDIVVSMTILPVGISYWSERQPGVLFGSENGCSVWTYLWEMAVAFSIFLVICLSVTRTISLLRPFRRQRVRYLIVATVMFIVLRLATLLGYHTQEGVTIEFNAWFASCSMSVSDTHNEVVVLILHVSGIITYIAPAFVVVTSCVISTVLLTRRNDCVQQR